MSEEGNSTQSQSLKNSLPPSSDPLQIYETQHFGFTPKSFTDGIYNAMIIYTRDGLSGVQNRLQDQFGHLMSSDQLDRASNNIFRKAVEGYDKCFDKLESYLTLNIFHIPDHVVLPEDQVQLQFPMAYEREADIDVKTKVLKEKIRAAQYVNACLEQEMTDIAEVQAEQDSLLQRLKTLEQIVTENGVSDLNETLRFLADKALQINQTFEKAELLIGPPPEKKAKIEEEIDEAMSTDSLDL